jgi:hypothetical protein
VVNIHTARTALYRLYDGEGVLLYIGMRHQAKEELLAADEELRELVAEGRAQGLGPSHLARLTGFTREWVAKIAPAPKST